MNKCPQCEGKGSVRVTVSVFGETGETASNHLDLHCPTCNGAKEISDEHLEAFMDFKESWCNCDTSDLVPYSTHFKDGEHPKVHKHHWRCDKCGGITQIG